MRHAGVLLLFAFSASPALCAVEVDYNRDVKPILEKHCYSCHGALRQKSDLRVDHITFLRSGGFRGPALTGDSSESPLIQAIAGSGDIEQMPLDAKPLSAEQIATIKAWVDAGAAAPDEPLPEDPVAHWSFQKPARPPLPEVKNADWASNPIDRFVSASHEREQLRPAPPADRNLLLRRVYVDLIGLPPTPEELRAFLADTSNDAYEKVVDRLLASPRYGERWGRHWMDVWRYSDWDGYQAEVRESQPHIWRWRDWIVESLNADKPYDQMVEEMLAADEIAPLDEDARRATGFLVRNWYKFNRNVWLDNTVEHTSKAFLGVTMNCARCHDHMYDPILQTDYYRFRAFFEPHQVRTDRVPGVSNTKQDGLVHAYDANADAPTYLFMRGNEGNPDKDNPLSPGVPKALGGDELRIVSVALPAETYYPGLRSFVQQEMLAKAISDVDRAEKSIGHANAALAELRKRHAELLAAKETSKSTDPPAGNGADAPMEPAKENGETDSTANPERLKGEVATAQRAVSLAESEVLAAAGRLVSVRATIAADKAAFASPPREDAPLLAREAARAERVANAQQSQLDLLRAEMELSDAQTAAPSDEKSEQRVAAAKKKLETAKKVREEHQGALAKSDSDYAHFGDVYPDASTGRRAALARWIASKDNPLTARVAINQIWMRHFGTPLVASVFDFGLHGVEPTHPKLLDWLAVELMEQDWQMKAIHRLIVMSRTYQMRSGATDASNLARDPENRYLWRANPRRMEAEVIRDSTLYVANALDVRMGGPELDQESGMSVPRRSLYFRSSKEKKMTFLDTFDRANVTDCYRRSETVVPQQALAMVNSSLSLAQARKLAGNMTAELDAQPASESDRKFIAAAFERILCRPATDEETSTCLEFLTEQAARLAQSNELAAFTAGDANAVEPAANPQQRARENLVHVLLNHNDFLTVR